MDIFENFFKVSANFWKRKKAALAEERGARFDDHFQTISLLARTAAGDFPLELRSVDDRGFLQGETLALPTVISRFQSSNLNRAVLFHQALFGGALYSLEKKSQPNTDYLSIVHFLSEQFPAFTEWHEEVLGALGNETQKGEQEFLSVNWRQSLQKEKRTFDEKASRRTRNQTQSEKEAKRPGEVESIDLDKQRNENNPVMHSFEKMETADEYRGGHRVTDASDELDSHSSALDELNLNKVTRSGENAQSVYRAEVADLFGSEETELTHSREDQFLWYPEWDYKKREMKLNHCRLYMGPRSKPSDDVDGDGNWKLNLEAEYSSELLRWEQQLLGLTNQRSWRDRQWDGEQVDIDAYIRYLSDVRSFGAGDGRVFGRRLPARRSISTLILLDQSYSTDSFVEGRRVLDVELESIGLAGLLLEKMADQVAVAGTWSETRSHCYFQWHKEFTDKWSSFYAQVPTIEPQGYTRLGPAIRHAVKALTETGARTKLLILLTDGKPTDFDRYEGRYGIEDIHHAFLEARQSGVEVKAMAIEKDAQIYFPDLFGVRNYQILNSPRQLPEALFRLYLEASKI